MEVDFNKLEEDNTANDEFFELPDFDMSALRDALRHYQQSSPLRNVTSTLTNRQERSQRSARKLDYSIRTRLYQDEEDHSVDEPQQQGKHVSTVGG